MLSHGLQCLVINPNIICVYAWEILLQLARKSQGLKENFHIIGSEPIFYVSLLPPVVVWGERLLEFAVHRLALSLHRVLLHQRRDEELGEAVESWNENLQHSFGGSINQICYFNNLQHSFGGSIDQICNSNLTAIDLWSLIVHITLNDVWIF